jgi:uncharacterized protein (TIGR02246 family)
MKSTSGCVALVPLLSLLAGCSALPTRSDSVDADLKAIEETNAKTLQALNTNDLELMNSLVAADHIMMIPNRPEIVGRAAIVASNKNLVETWTNVEIWHPAETVVSGDLAYQRGTFDITLTPKKEGARPIRSVGKYIHIYQRQRDGRWLMTRDIFNDNGPRTDAAPAGAPAGAQGESR